MKYFCLLTLFLALTSVCIAQEGRPAFELIPVAEGVYAAIKPERISRVFTCNSAVIVNDHDVVVVDGDGWPSAARALITKIRNLTDKPVRTLVITHGAPDHVQATYVWQEAFPGLEIIAHEETPRLMREVTLPYVAGQRVRLQQAIASTEQELNKGSNEQGEQLSKQNEDRLQRHLQSMKSYESDLTEVSLLFPTTTFSRHMTLYRGNREIHLLFHGGGHTSGDVVVYLPMEKILVTGDLVMSDRPFTAIASVLMYRNSLRELLKLDFEYLIPGHGPLLRGKDYMQLTSDLAQKLIEEVRQAKEENLTLEQTKKAVDLKPFQKRFADVGPEFAIQFDRQIPRAIETTYIELSARPQP